MKMSEIWVAVTLSEYDHLVGKNHFICIQGMISITGYFKEIFYKDKLM